MPDQIKEKTARRPWWQRLCRAMLAGLLLLSAAYVALPWWAPVDAIRRRLEQRMTGQLGLGVRIGNLSLSWRKGIILRHLSIASPAGFGEEPMVHVERIATELSPLRLLLTGRLDLLEMDGLRLTVAFNSAGEVNLAALGGSPGGLAAGRVSVHRGLAVVQWPQQEDPLRLRITSLEFHEGPSFPGELTMSGLLEQHSHAAPVSLHLGRGQGPEVVALASLSFSNAELGQLPLRKLNLPLKKLSGACAGSIEMEVNRSGIINQCRGNLSVARLDVQPSDGPPLPVVDLAGLSLAASFDPITGQVQVHRLKVSLPGVELAGGAEMTLDIHDGQWGTIRSLDLRGQIQPANLAGLLTGTSALPLGLEVRGLLDVRLASRLEGFRLNLEASAKADSATITRGASVVKPADIPFRAEFKGSLDSRNWQLEAESAEFAWGSNRFSGAGTIGDLREISSAARSTDPKALLGRLAQSDWNGSCEIGDLDSLKLALPEQRWLSGAHLKGTVSGRWFIDRSQEPRVHFRCEAGADSRLTFGEYFVQPASQPIRLDLSGTIDAEGAKIKDMDADLAVGDGRLSVGRSSLSLEASDKSPAANWAGQYEISGVESFATAFPCLKSAGIGLNGGITGRLNLTASAERQEFLATANLRNLRLALGRDASRPLGLDATAELTAIHDLQAAEAQRNRVQLAARLPEAMISARASFPDAAKPDEDSTRLELNAEVTDAGALCSSLPALGERLGSCRLSGGAALRALLDVGESGFRGEVVCDATGLGVAAGKNFKRIKSAGTPLELKLSGRLKEDAAGDLRISLEDSQVQLGASRLGASGSIVRKLPVESAATSVPADGSLASCQLKFSGQCAIDEAVKGLLPEIAELAAKHGFKGAAGIRGDVRSSPKGASIRAAIDAKAMAMNEWPTGLSFPVAGGTKRAVNLVKPEGLPAEITIEATTSAGWGEVLINNVLVNVGDLTMLADGLIVVESERDGALPGVKLRRAHLSASTSRIEGLSAFAPALETYRLSGRAGIDADWDANDPDKLTRLGLSLDKLAGRCNGKDFLLDGAVLARQIELGEAGPRVQSFATDGLEFRVGTNHGWIVADMRNIYDRAVGEFHLLGEGIDDKELVDWFSGRSPTSQPASAVASTQPTQPASAPDLPVAAPMSDKERQRRLYEADDVFRKARGWLLAANIDARVSIDRYRTYDAAVGRSYEARYFNLKALVNGGQAELEYGASINGGVIRANCQADLTEASPKVSATSSISGVQADESIQPQLARFFPGNTVFGTFGKTETSTVPLRQVVARMSHPSTAVFPTGTAKTVTTDGLLQGRSAPKFVTRVFPGLNLTRYRYDKMTAFAEFLHDGTTENDMVFSGKTYDIYIEGTTDRSNIGRYKIGLILLGTPQSAEWNHTYKLGRIPLLNFKARIEGGRMLDEEVTPMYPNQFAFQVLLKNNLFYRVWLASRKKP